MRRISLFFPCSSGTAWPPRGAWPGLLVRELVFTLNMDGCPELARMELVAELLEREAAMLIALERMEAGMLVCPARD
jgi:hypothetical protein